MLLNVGVCFFLLGALAKLCHSGLKFPPGLYQSLSLFLLVSIGLKGGQAMAAHFSSTLLLQGAAVVAFGFFLPLLAYPVLRHIGRLPKVDAASIAAHYGSVSVGTYAVAAAYLEAKGVAYEAYFPLFVALLEVPAIVVGLALAGRVYGDNRIQLKAMLHELFLNQSMVLLVGGLLIGFVAAEQLHTVKPFFFDLFHGVLALFLLEMGILAASRVVEFKRLGRFMLAFGVAMPLVSSVFGVGLGLALGLSVGGVALMACLAASASYIAVPAAMRGALPEADHGMSISASLAISFPFNVILGVPLYLPMAEAMVT